MLYAHAISCIQNVISDCTLDATAQADCEAGIAALKTAANPEGATFLERLQIEHHSRRHERDLLKLFLESGKAKALVAPEMEELLNDQLKAQNSLVAILEKRLQLLGQ